MANTTFRALLSVLLLSLFLSSFVAAQGSSRQSQQQTRQSDARQCRLQQLTASQPSRRIESEGGVTELWDEYDDQFQCAGVAAMRNNLQPNSLSLPNFSPSPRLVYIQQGRGMIGIAYPGCGETYHSRGQQSSRGTQGRREQQGRMADQHQKVHRIRRGDVVAIPAGAAHWCVNDGNEELIAVSVTDLNNQANQLDQQKARSFYLAGATQSQQGSTRMPVRKQSEQERETFQNVFQALDENMIAEAFGISVDIVRRMQKQDNRGLIVKVQEGELEMLRPEEEEEESYEHQGRRINGLEETTYCTMKINQYLDDPREADVYSRQAGRINTVNMHKLPILRYLGMSAEKGDLRPRAMHAPHWKMNAHSIVYITRGEGRLQVVGNNGKTMFDDRVNEGDMVVIPQYFTSMKRAGQNGLEWVNFQTSAMPMESPLAGSTSVMKGMPLEVLTNSYQMSYKDARDLKYNREQHVKLVPPSRTSSS